MLEPLVLASTSPFRAQLLNKLEVPFVQAAPDVDETPLADEPATELVPRLTEAKARAVAADFPQHLIVASDQVAVHKGCILGKPGSHSKAVAQLTRFSGNAVTFITGLALLNSATDQLQLATETFTVHFRALTQNQIEHYLLREQPYNCAGSFKSEGLGITLFSALEGTDPNTLVGLPLIRLTDFLCNEGFVLPLPTA